MGYMLSSLGHLPIEENVTLYIFVINGGFRGGRYEVIERNFGEIAKRIGPNAIIVKGFEESWSAEVAQKYLGKNHHELLNLLPALLLTDSHPDKLTKDSFRLLIPLKNAEARFEDLETFFRALTNFANNRDKKFLKLFMEEKDFLAKVNKIFEIKPNICGIGININAFIEGLRKT